MLMASALIAALVSLAVRSSEDIWGWIKNVEDTYLDLRNLGRL